MRPFHSVMAVSGSGVGTNHPWPEWLTDEQLFALGQHFGNIGLTPWVLNVAMAATLPAPNAWFVHCPQCQRRRRPLGRILNTHIGMVLVISMAPTRTTITKEPDEIIGTAKHEIVSSEGERSSGETKVFGGGHGVEVSPSDAKKLTGRRAQSAHHGFPITGPERYRERFPTLERLYQMDIHAPKTDCCAAHRFYWPHIECGTHGWVGVDTAKLVPVAS